MAVPRLTIPARRRLLRLFVYDPATGDLIWRERPASDFISVGEAKRWNGRYAGTVAGWNNSTGRWVTINGTDYQAHRVIWRILHPGRVPSLVDHRDLNKRNGRADNLRAATSSQNNANVTMRRNNSTGYKGVYEDHGKFRAQIRHDGIVYYLGRFLTKEEAYAAYCAEADRLHGEFARYE